MLSFVGGRGMVSQPKQRSSGGERIGVHKPKPGNGQEPLFSWPGARTCAYSGQLFLPPLRTSPELGGFSPSLWKKVRGGFSWKRGFLSWFLDEEASYISACLSRWLRVDERGLLLEEGPPQSSNQPGQEVGRKSRSIVQKGQGAPSSSAWRVANTTCGNSELRGT